MSLVGSTRRSASYQQMQMQAGGPFGFLKKLAKGAYAIADSVFAGGALPGGVPLVGPGPQKTSSRVIQAAGLASTGAAAATAVNRMRQPMRDPRSLLPPPPGLVPNGLPMLPPATGGRAAQPIRWIANEPTPPKGYVPNKSQYYRTDPMSGQVVLIMPKTVWVRRRSRNNLNPKAFDRAVARVEGAKKFEERAKRITVKCKCCNLVNCKRK